MLEFKGRTDLYSSVVVKGKTNNLAIDASSSADCDAKELISNVAQVLASTSSDVNVLALKSLDATASTSASIKYYGKLDKVKIRFFSMFVF